MIEVLSVASEAYPLIKTGGLADVVGALPAALAAHDVTARTLLPGYPAVMGALEGGRALRDYADFFGGPAELIAGRAGGLDIIALNAPHLFARAGNPYLGPARKDWPANWKRFAALSFAAYEIGGGAAGGEFQPQILHCHDWQAGLVPAYVRFNSPTPVKTILTVHNIAFQGLFGWEIFNALRLDYRAAQESTIEYYGLINYLKAGLQVADQLTTVSPTYANEIKTEAYGMGLQGLLLSRADALVGITNGIDEREWDPQTDKALHTTYSHNSTEARAANRRALELRFNIDDSAGPLFSVVSRLTTQKGLDMLVGLVERNFDEGEAHVRSNAAPAGENEDCGDTGEHARNGEGDGNDAIGADAHQPHHGEIARGRPHGDAEIGMVEEEHQRADRQDGGAEFENLERRDGIGADMPGRAQTV